MKKKVISNALCHDLPPPKAWQWISKYEKNPHLRVAHPKHQRWMRDHQETHLSREIMVCLTGEHIYGFQGNVWKFTPGTIMLLDRDDAHDAIYSPYQSECRDLWFHVFSSSFFSANEVIVSKARNKPQSSQVWYTTGHSKPFAETVSLAWSNCNDHPQNPWHITQLKAAVTAMIIEVILHGNTQVKSPERVAQQGLVVDEVKRYIQTHLAEPLSLVKLAKIAGYDPIYFHRLFVGFVGEPLHHFVNRLRLERSQEMLLDGLKLSAIATEIGFTSSAYFCRFFKRTTGKKPSEWLEKNR